MALYGVLYCWCLTAVHSGNRRTFIKIIVNNVVNRVNWVNRPSIYIFHQKYFEFISDSKQTIERIYYGTPQLPYVNKSTYKNVYQGVAPPPFLRQSEKLKSFAVAGLKQSNYDIKRTYKINIGFEGS